MKGVASLFWLNCDSYKRNKYTQSLVYLRHTRSCMLRNKSSSFFSFYIILKGSVAVLIKESTDDDGDLTREIDRSMLGIPVSILGKYVMCIIVQNSEKLTIKC